MSDTYPRTEKRINKIKWVLSKRQPSLYVVIENVHDPHNVSAILRTCDAAGIPRVSLVYNVEKFPKIGKKSSASAYKWMQRDKFKTIDECYKKLKEDGFSIYASSLDADSTSLFDLDFTKKAAIVLGNEHRGLSNESIESADEKFYIPMFGMVQSLNVSVSAAISIYEAVRQRLQNGMYEKSEVNEADFNYLVDQWSKK